MADDPFLTSLLYEEEGTSLDFKREQYRFFGASDTDKAELLKDILAFANAWRRSDAYILIGVEEQPGAKATVLGITDHLKDADLQQFVNSKTNAPVDLSYAPADLEGKSVGVIRIPVQDRPRYLLKAFGGLKPDVVYIRRGSSTDIAKPDEIARMGAAALQNAPAEVPILKLQFAEMEDRVVIGDTLDRSSLFLDIQDIDDLPDYDPEPPSYGGITLSTSRTPNKDYFREFAAWSVAQRGAHAVRFAITNDSATTAVDVRAELVVNSSDAFLYDEDSWPSAPEAEYYSFAPRHLSFRHHDDVLDVTTKQLKDRWVVDLSVEKVQPKSTAWLQNVLYVGSKHSGDLTFEGTVTADNIPIPQPVRLVVKFTVDIKAVTLADALEADFEKRRHT